MFLKDNKEKIDNYIGLITIEDYLWETNPQQLVDIKNLFLQDKIKIVKG